MKTILSALLLATTLTACAHSEMTGDEHRVAAATAEKKAALEEEKYKPYARAHAVVPRAPIDMQGDVAASIDVLQEYNPTEGHLLEADRQMSIAYKHDQRAAQLEQIEEAACAGVSEAERNSCPVLAPHLYAIQERKEGVTLVMKPGSPADRLAGQLRCHLAFAKANNFDRVPCPLFMKGVTFTHRSTNLIDVFSKDAKVATQVRLEARRMFGVENAPVSKN